MIVRIVRFKKEPNDDFGRKVRVWESETLYEGDEVTHSRPRQKDNKPELYIAVVCQKKCVTEIHMFDRSETTGIKREADIFIENDKGKTISRFNSEPC